MKRVSIVGLGMSAQTLTAQGRQALEEAEVLLGSARLLDLDEICDLCKPSFALYEPGQVAEFIEASPAERFCVLVSGDPGFYSAAHGLRAALECWEVTVVPGISSLSCLFARLGRPWQEAKLLSCHGREANLADAVRRNRLTFALTGGNLPALGQALERAGFGALTAWVGEDLGSTQERVTQLPASALSARRTGGLAVLLVENPAYDSRVRFGIPDGEFIRGEVPMTKAEVRAVTLSRLALSPGAVCWDVGAGTGSVTVEMALAAYEGSVYAVDQSPQALRLVEENCRAFHLGNVTPVAGRAPEVLSKLPPPDAVFIGGSGGRLEEIFSLALEKNPQARIVVNAVTLETAGAALRAFQTRGMEPELTQLSVARGRAAGPAHMLCAQSPVFILSGGGGHG